jgi:hypothetical protein
MGVHSVLHLQGGCHMMRSLPLRSSDSKITGTRINFQLISPENRRLSN